MYKAEQTSKRRAQSRTRGKDNKNGSVTSLVIHTHDRQIIKQTLVKVRECVESLASENTDFMDRLDSGQKFLELLDVLWRHRSGRDRNWQTRHKFHAIGMGTG